MMSKSINTRHVNVNNIRDDLFLYTHAKESSAWNMTLNSSGSSMVSSTPLHWLSWAGAAAIFSPSMLEGVRKSSSEAGEICFDYAAASLSPEQAELKSVESFAMAGHFRGLEDGKRGLLIAGERDVTCKKKTAGNFSCSRTTKDSEIHLVAT